MDEDSHCARRVEYAIQDGDTHTCEHTAVATTRERQEQQRKLLAIVESFAKIEKNILFQSLRTATSLQ